MAQQERIQNSDSDVPVAATTERHPTACFRCRAARQRCDRGAPCSRCISQEQPCHYPAGSNRGRKQGSTKCANVICPFFISSKCSRSSSKPATVEKLLSLINESPVRDQVIASLLKNHLTPERAPPSSPSRSGTLPSCSCSTYSSEAGAIGDHVSLAANSQRPAQLDVQGSFVSPLRIVAAAAAADAVPSLPTSSFRGLPGNPAASVPTQGLLARYFAPQVAYENDWQVLDRRSNSVALKLDATACDPVNARLIDQDDVAWYFELFYKLRNPLVGLLDPLLHTSAYIHSTSFTLFTVICALGCAVSTRPRDRLLYPALLAIAESNVQWSIAVSVKTIETIQAIVILQYWAPVGPRQSDDPYWLHLSHAVQLARDIGIHRGISIGEQVNFLAADATADFKERLTRNFERTWLYMFIAEKSFGIITGRSPCVSWKEIPLSVADWWRRPMTGPIDRVISGVAEIRCHLLNALEQKKNTPKTMAAIYCWHSRAFDSLIYVQSTRCAPDNDPSGAFLHVLTFYMEHSILVLSTQTLRELTMMDAAETSVELRIVAKQTLDVACRLLDLVLSNQLLNELMVGFHNNQFIMICHAVTEITQAIKRGTLASDDIPLAASKVRAVSMHLERIAQELPTTSAIHLYSELCRFFVCQIDEYIRFGNGQDNLFADWWKAVEVGSLDSNMWFDMSFLTSNDSNTRGSTASEFNNFTAS